MCHFVILVTLCSNFLSHFVIINLKFGNFFWMGSLRATLCKNKEKKNCFYKECRQYPAFWQNFVKTKLSALYKIGHIYWSEYAEFDSELHLSTLKLLFELCISQRCLRKVVELSKKLWKFCIIIDNLFLSFMRFFTNKKIRTINRNNRSGVFLVKGVPKICSKFTGEHPYRSVISIKLLWSPLPFFRNTSGWLLLH